MHRYQRPGSEGMPVPLNATALSEGANEDRAEDEDADTPMFQKYSPLLHGGAAAEVEDGAAASGAGGAGAGERLTRCSRFHSAFSLTPCTRRQPLPLATPITAPRSALDTPLRPPCNPFLPPLALPHPPQAPPR